MRTVRVCSRAGCQLPAVATLTYAYSDSTAVVGPLATASEPHSYDLCGEHAVRLTAPKGWEVVRHEGDYSDEPSSDELTALAEAVREAGRPSGTGASAPPPETDGPAGPGGRRGHLRVLPNPVK